MCSSDLGPGQKDRGAGPGREVQGKGEKAGLPPWSEDENSSGKYLYGTSPVLFHTIENPVLTRSVGTNNLRVVSALPHSKQSAVASLGSATLLSEAYHSVRELKKDYSGPYWDADILKLPSAVDFRCGKGRVIYFVLRSEERRVGKECRSRWSPYQ